MLVACHHDSDISNAAIGDRPFRARQTTADDTGVNAGRVRIAVALRQGEASNQRAVGDPGQIFVPLGVRSGCQDCLRCQIRCRAKRHWRHGAPQFLGEHAQSLIAEAHTAEFFGNGRADPPHLGHCAPQIRCVGFLPVQRPPNHRGRTLLGQKPSGLVAELLQVVGKVEVHVDFPPPANCQRTRAL